MYLLRRTAFKAIASAAASAPLARNARPVISVFQSSYQPNAVTTGAQSISFRRTYASETEKPKAQDENKPSEQAQEQSQEQSQEQVKQQAQDTVESVVESVRDGAANLASKASSAVSQGIDAVTEDTGYSKRNTPRGLKTAPGHPEAQPSSSLYVGNLYFEVAEGTLRKEFERFGKIKSVKILYDARGLSKGFGYVDFEDQADAEEAQKALNNQVLEGRRLAVQYAVRKGDRRRDGTNVHTPRNPPSRTLFIGNMSYEMTDKDLNDLFREIKNVLDVRVAIDRRTGNPRGFAHADFIDTASAEAAADYLRTKTFYGRNLRIDFSTSGTGNASARIVDKKKDGGES